MILRDVVKNKKIQIEMMFSWLVIDIIKIYI